MAAHQASPLQIVVPAIAASVDARAAVVDRVADALHRRHASDEVLQAFHEKESISIGRCIADCRESHAQSSPARRHMLCCVSKMLIVMRAEGNSWFQAARVLDVVGVVCRSVADVLPTPEVMHSRAAALCLVAEALAGHSTRSVAPGPRRASLAAYATSASTSIGGKPVSLTDILLEEHTLLRCLDSAPSVACWVSVFSTRFDVATNGVFGTRLMVLESTACKLAMRVVLRLCTSATHPPRRVAMGCFALALVAMRVVPASSLRPEGMDEDSWSFMLSPLTPHGRAAASNEQPPLPSRIALAVLELAMQHDAGAIRAHSLAALQAAAVATETSASI